MTDVLPRLEDAFDGSDRKTLDRRQLLKAGAWAAPVIVLATAAPAAANTSGTTPTTGTTTVTGKATDLITQVGVQTNYYDGVQHYFLNLFYAFGGWGQGGDAKTGAAPGQLSIVYSVTLTHGNQVISVETNAVANVAAYTNFQPGWKQVAGLSKGAWELVWSFTSVTPTPNQIGSKKFVVDGLPPAVKKKFVVN